MIRTNTDATEVGELSVSPGGEKAPKSFFLRQRNWKEMSPTQKGSNIMLGIVKLVLTAWALWDIKNRPEG